MVVADLSTPLRGKEDIIFSHAGKVRFRAEVYSNNGAD